MNRRDIEPGPLAEVAGRPDGGRWTLVFVRDLPHPPEKVWAALTEPAKLAAGRPTPPTVTWGAPVTRPSR